MDKFFREAGNVQKKVGYVADDMKVIVAYILAGILTIIAIGLAITALIPMKPWDCDNDVLQGKKDFMDSGICDTQDIAYNKHMCEDATNDYNSEKQRCNTKVKHLWLLWFLLLIPLGILIVIFFKWYDNFAHHHKMFAIFDGTEFEVSTLKNIFSN
jgi:hypothetical protein